MVGIILITENKESLEMLKTVKRLLGHTRGFKALILKPGVSTAHMTTLLKETIRKISPKDGIILLTDMYGSTQCNVCLPFLKKGAVELVTGFNLPMLIKLGNLNRTTPLKKLTPFIEEYGKIHMRHIKNQSAPKKRKKS